MTAQNLGDFQNRPDFADAEKLFLLFKYLWGLQLHTGSFHQAGMSIRLAINFSTDWASYRMRRRARCVRNDNFGSTLTRVQLKRPQNIAPKLGRLCKESMSAAAHAFLQRLRSLPITMASPHHRHQSSLEGVLDFSSPQPLEPDQRNRATDIFNQIVAQYESSQINDKGYKRITLLRVAHDSVISRDNFLSCFFLFVEKELRQVEDVSELSLSQALSRYANLDSWSRQQREELETSLATFSDYLVDNFFLPRALYIPYVTDILTLI